MFRTCVGVGILSPGALQAVVLLGQLLYGLLQMVALLPLMLQGPLPPAVVRLCHVQEVSAGLGETHGDGDPHGTVSRSRHSLQEGGYVIHCLVTGRTGEVVCW